MPSLSKQLSDQHGHDEIEKYSCPVCVRELGLLDKDEPTPSEIETVVNFVAQFDGPCRFELCKAKIEVGDEVSLVVYDDDNKLTMHRDCAEKYIKETV